MLKSKAKNKRSVFRGGLVLRQPYISIIIPIYNVEQYLDECIQSILTQTWNDYEVILVDDGSTDKCPQMCDTYQEMYSNIAVIHNQNGGLSDARNAGLKKAQGKYVLFVDSDDYIKKGSLKIIYECCKENDEPDIIFLSAEKVFSDGKIVKYDTVMNNQSLIRGKKSAITYLSGREKYPASAWSKLIKRKFLIENNIEFKKGQLSEDYEWTLSCILSAKSMAACNESYYCYRQNRVGSITENVSKKHFDDLLDIIKQFVDKAEHTPEYRTEILRFAAYIYRCMLWSAEPYYNDNAESIRKYRYLLQKGRSRDIKIINATVSVFGIKKTIGLLGLYRKLRR